MQSGKKESKINKDKEQSVKSCLHKPHGNKLHWFLQSNPIDFELNDYLSKNKKNENEIAWGIKYGKKGIHGAKEGEIKKGQEVFIWRSKGNSNESTCGIIARGKIHDIQNNINTTYRTYRTLNPNDPESLWKIKYRLIWFSANKRVTCESISAHDIALQIKPKPVKGKPSELVTYAYWIQPNIVSSEYKLSDLNVTLEELHFPSSESAWKNQKKFQLTDNFLVKCSHTKTIEATWIKENVKVNGKKSAPTKEIARLQKKKNNSKTLVFHFLEDQICDKPVLLNKEKFSKEENEQLILLQQGKKTEEKYIKTLTYKIAKECNLRGLPKTYSTGLILKLDPLFTNLLEQAEAVLPKSFIDHESKKNEKIPAIKGVQTWSISNIEAHGCYECLHDLWKKKIRPHDLVLKEKKEDKEKEEKHKLLNILSAEKKSIKSPHKRIPKKSEPLSKTLVSDSPQSASASSSSSSHTESIEKSKKRKHEKDEESKDLSKKHKAEKYKTPFDKADDSKQFESRKAEKKKENKEELNEAQNRIAKSNNTVFHSISNSSLYSSTLALMSSSSSDSSSSSSSSSQSHLSSNSTAGMMINLSSSNQFSSVSAGSMMSNFSSSKENEERVKKDKARKHETSEIKEIKKTEKVNFKTFVPEINPGELDYEKEGDILFSKYKDENPYLDEQVPSTSPKRKRNEKNSSIKKYDREELTQESKDLIGRRGELFVYKKLKAKYKAKYQSEPENTETGFKVEGVHSGKGHHPKRKGQKRTVEVHWHNKKKGVGIEEFEESGKSTDFKITKTKVVDEKEEIITRYAEVKSTRSNKAHGTDISPKEWKEMVRHGNRYFFFRVLNIDKECAGEINLQKIKNPLEKVTRGHIQVDSIKIKI